MGSRLDHDSSLPHVVRVPWRRLARQHSRPGLSGVGASAGAGVGASTAHRDCIIAPLEEVLMFAVLLRSNFTCAAYVRSGRAQLARRAPLTRTAPSRCSSLRHSSQFVVIDAIFRAPLGS